MNSSDSSTRQLFLVQHAKGNVRSSTNEFIGFEFASSPGKAIKKFLPSYASSWVLHPDSKTNNYARIENPVSFVSDMIDNYNATAVMLLQDKDKNGLYIFSISAVMGNGLTFDAQTVKTVSAKNAENALKEYLGKEYKNWTIDKSVKSDLYLTALPAVKDDKGIQQYIVMAEYIIVQ